MSRRGGCRHCAWLRNNGVCTSEKAMGLTARGSLKPFFGQKVKIAERFFDPQLQRYAAHIEWSGCFKFTFPKMRGGVSGFLREHIW